METPHLVRKKCKKCGKGELDSRVRRPLLMKAALFWLPLKRYQCNYCSKRSYVFGSTVSKVKASQNNLHLL